MRRKRPAAVEVTTRRRPLAVDAARFADVRVVLALGEVAHDAWIALLRARGLPIRPSGHPFAHGALHEIDRAPPLLDSFHPSPLNTRARKMSRAQWRAIWRRAARFVRQPRYRWFVYVARCGDGTLYTGITNDLERRRARHESGRGARYTRGRGPIEIIHVEPAVSRGAALSREHTIKRLPRNEKLRLGSVTTSGRR